MSYLETTEFTLDWLQGVLPFSDVRQLFKDLGQFDSRLKYENWSVMGNLRNYRTRFICQGRASVSIAYNDDPLQDPYNKNLWYSSELNDDVSLIAENHPFNPGIFVSISGDGLRWLNQVDGTVDKIIKYLRFEKFKCSRLDLACDIFDPKNNLVPNVIKAFKNCFSVNVGKLNIVSNMCRTSGKNGSVKLYPYVDCIRQETPKQVWNVTFGNHGSSFGMFRCYDKWFEIASGRLNNYSSEMLKKLTHKYWYRLEYEVHNGKMNNHAADLFNSLADGKVNIQTAFGQVAGKMFRIVKPKSISNLAMAPIFSVWEQFLSYCEYFVQLGVVEWVTQPWVEKTAEQLVYYVRRHIPKLATKIFEMFNASPSLRDEVLEEGRNRMKRDAAYKQAEFEATLSMLRCT